MKTFFKDLGKPWQIYAATIFVFLLSFILFPYLFTQFNMFGISYDSTGQIGDTIGGISSPFIAFIGAYLTFIAFWVQYKSNKSQTEQFNKQSLKDKVENFENNFFILLNLHNRNIDELSINKKLIKREVFQEYFLEIESLTIIFEKIYGLKEFSNLNLDSFEKINLIYQTFFIGIAPNNHGLLKSILGIYNDDLVSKFLRQVFIISESFNSSSGLVGSNYLLNNKYIVKPFQGHLQELGHYFRNLYLIVKFVDQSDLEFKVKYTYIKILRAQLSSYEQLILYYNSISQIGRNWINNDYIKKYKIIKNLPIPLITFSPTPFEYLEKFKIDKENFFEWDEILN